MEAIRVRNPAAYDLPEMDAFLSRALESSPAKDQYLAVKALQRYAPREELGVFVTRENGELAGLIVVMLPTTPLYGYPQVYWVYNEGGSESREALSRAAVDFSQEAGFEAFRTMTANNGGAFERLWKGVGEISKVGTIFEFQIKRH